MISLDLEALEKNGKHKRLRKVYYCFSDNEYGPKLPMIRMKGKYLEDYGFYAGDGIEILIEAGKITITKLIEAEKFE